MSMIGQVFLKEKEKNKRYALSVMRPLKKLYD